MIQSPRQWVILLQSLNLSNPDVKHIRDVSHIRHARMLVILDIWGLTHPTPLDKIHTFFLIDELP